MRIFGKWNGPRSHSSNERCEGIPRSGHPTGRTLILDPPVAREMIARAEQLGVGILGIDGFWITETTTQPDMGYSIDLGLGGNWSEAAAFVRARADLGLMFEIVTDEDTRDLVQPGNH